ncbi:MAG: VOC family protein [Flavobacterium sp.]|nr:VOC family protein [Flavobacterium sp.]
MHDYLSGIQQIGIGVSDAEQAMFTYKNLFGMNILIFDDIATACLMKKYTGNQEFKRRAILTMNLNGGGGFEIWQFLDRKPVENLNFKLGDLGINAAILKSNKLEKSHERLKILKSITVSDIQVSKVNVPYFFVNDGINNFKIIPDCDWFQNGKHDLGGVVGAVIGVSDMQKSLHFYQHILGLDIILYEYEFVEHNISYKKVGLQKNATGKGAFNELLGNIMIELVQNLDSLPTRIYKNRFWGDTGFIHLCFDVLDMNALKKHAESNNYKFSVDSNNTYAMDNASGRFCYIEDPDGTLIELVETHKVPILKKMGWYLDLRKRNKEKPLPRWMIKMLSLSKVK